eukprot:tig00021759_g23422.t1
MQPGGAGRPWPLAASRRPIERSASIEFPEYMYTNGRKQCPVRCVRAAVVAATTVLLLAVAAAIVFAFGVGGSSGVPGLRQSRPPQASRAAPGSDMDPELVNRATAAAVANGGISVSLLLPAGDLMVSIRANISMPPSSEPSASKYFCRAYRLAGTHLTSLYHATRLHGRVLSRHLHHMLVFGCLAPIEQWRYERYYPCAEMEDVSCWTIIGGTADVSVDSDFYPTAGMPFGVGAYGDAYVAVIQQWHYTYTQNEVGLLDHSGVDLILTPRLRPHSVGSIGLWYPHKYHAVNGTAIAAEVSAGIIPPLPRAIIEASRWFLLNDTPPIPPARPAVEYVVTCPPLGLGPLGYGSTDSLEYAVPPEGANITHVWPHMHLTGSRIWAELYRLDTSNDGDGRWQYVREVYRWDSYFFHGQRFFELPDPILILPTDRLVLHCEFNSMNRTKPTVLGTGILDEMCTIFFQTVPRLPFAAVEPLAKARGVDPLIAVGMGSVSFGGVVGWPQLEPLLVDRRPVAGRR